MCLTSILYCTCCKKDLITHRHCQCSDYDQCFTRKYYLLESRNRCPSCVSHSEEICNFKSRPKSVTVTLSRKMYFAI